MSSLSMHVDTAIENESSLVFGLSVSELVFVALLCLPFVLLIGVMIKKMGFSDSMAIGLAILMLTPLNWLVLGYLVFFKWPIHQELELLKRRVEEKATPGNIRQEVRKVEATPLHVAVQKGYTDVVESLVSQDVDLDAKTANGQTALQLAIACGHDEIADLLRRHGATS